MKLIRVKLLSSFRGLPKNFEITFQNHKIDPKKIEPICLIGLNGSGKSNLLEVISEIFYFLENFSRARNSEIKKFKTSFGFEIEYYLSRNVFNTNKASDYKEAKNYQIKVLITKKIDEAPKAFALDDDFEYICESPDNFSSYLPNQIIAYSSGMNELISNPFIKMDFQYLEDFAKLSNNSLDTLSDNRMFFMDYDANKLITISNFLFDESFDESNLGVINLKPIKDELQIKNIHSFSISIKLRDNNKKKIKLPSVLNIAIEDLKKCATIFEENKKKSYTEYQFYFYVNSATKKLFKRYFKSANELYKRLYYFRLLNNHLISQKTIKNIQENSKNINISALLPKHEENEKVFNIFDIAFRKQNTKNIVYYKQLSDGEHQFLQVFGILLLVDKLGTLFLFDEPETHFNPDWRSKFVNIANKSIFNEDIFREQELILTTHSPFIVSDCRQENVYQFTRDKKTKKILSPSNPDFQTYGTSIEMIYWNIFKKHQSISDIALDELNAIKEKIVNNKLSKNEAIKELSRFGDSFEKMNIINILREKFDK